MTKTLSTLCLSLFVLLTTGSFGYAEILATEGGGSFPYFHLGCLIVGGLIIVSLKHRYPRMFLSEAIGSFALYALLVTLLTAPVVDLLRTFIA